MHVCASNCLRKVAAFVSRLRRFEVAPLASGVCCARLDDRAETNDRTCVSWRAAVKGGERLHFAGRELPGRCAHLLIDIILAAALGEGGKLPFDVGGVLPLQRRRADLETAGAMTGGTGRN